MINAYYFSFTFSFPFLDKLGEYVASQARGSKIELVSLDTRGSKIGLVSLFLDYANFYPKFVRPTQIQTNTQTRTQGARSYEASN